MEGVARHVRDDADGAALLQQVEASGLPLHTWCRQNGVVAHSLYWYRRKQRRLQAAPVTALVEVKVKDLVRAVPATYEVVLDNGRVVRVGSDFEDDVVLRLVGLLERAC